MSEGCTTCLRFGAFCLPAVDHFAVGAGDFENAVGPGPFAAAGEGGVDAGQVHDGHLVGAERHGGVGAQFGFETELLGDVDNLFDPDLVGELNRDGVDRTGQRRHQGHLAVIAARIVARRPVADPDRPVDDNRVRAHAGGKRTQIDDRLERRPGLALRFGRAVELADFVVPPADDGLDRAGGVHGNQRGLAGAIRLAVLVERIVDDLLCPGSADRCRSSS